MGIQAERARGHGLIFVEAVFIQTTGIHREAVQGHGMPLEAISCIPNMGTQGDQAQALGFSF